jgi:glycosyltransferase involved in cell wall biosynthesis
MIELHEGPKVFISRLMQHLDLPGNTLISNPSNSDINLSKKLLGKSLIIGRLDGLTFYDFSYSALSSYLKSTNHYLLSCIVPRNFRVPKFANFALNRFLNRNARWLYSNSNGLVFQSKLSYEMHVHFNGFNNYEIPCDIIHNGIDTNDFKIDPSCKLKGYPSLIISASTFRLYKRLRDAIILTNLLCTEFPNIHLNIIGECDSLTLNSIKNLNISRCTFHGRISQSALPKYYGGADIQLSLSLFDACPNVVIEGLACGLPVVTPKESGAFELIGNSNSDWAVTEDVKLDFTSHHCTEHVPAIPFKQYISKIISITQNLKDHSDSARLRAISNLDIKITAKKYSEFIEKVLDEHT